MKRRVSAVAELSHWQVKQGQEILQLLIANHDVYFLIIQIQKVEVPSDLFQITHLFIVSVKTRVQLTQISPN